MFSGAGDLFTLDNAADFIGSRQIVVEFDDLAAVFFDRPERRYKRFRFRHFQFVEIASVAEFDLVPPAGVQLIFTSIGKTLFVNLQFIPARPVEIPDEHAEQKQKRQRADRNRQPVFRGDIDQNAEQELQKHDRRDYDRLKQTPPNAVDAPQLAENFGEIGIFETIVFHTFLFQPY
jgi:hypothetical protein